jgi:myo-inositol-1(or 4)-monophosphatase
MEKILDRALEASGRVLKSYFGKVTPTYKGRADLLTQADTASQKAILDLVRRHFPDHDYLAEEKESKLTGAEYAWIIDPLDGTTNYAHGYPMCCTSIGVLRRGKPFLAGVNAPFHEERFTAKAGRGAKVNGRPMHVSKAATLSKALLITGFAYDRQDEKRSRFYVENYRRFMVKSHDIRRSGSAALDLAWIAAGRADGFWEYGLNPWDVAAGWLLVQEAGGKITDFSGRPWTFTDALGKQTLAANGRLHPHMLKILKERQ